MDYLQTAWSLSDLFPGLHSPDLRSAMDQIEEQVSRFEGGRPHLTSGIQPPQFLAIVGALEETSRVVSKLYAFGGLSFAANSQDQAAQSFLARMDQFSAEMANRTLFFSLWWKELDEANAGRLMEAAGDYRYYLEQWRHFQPHTLSESEEKVINLKNVTGINALNTLYDSIVHRYAFKLNVQGEEKELTEAELASYRSSPDPDLRARSYQEQFRVFGGDAAILGQIYQTTVRDWQIENLSLRKFPSSIAARNLGNDIPDVAVEVLLEVSKKNAGIFQRYFKLKAKLLGVQKLRRYDIYAPVSNSAKKFEYAAAVQMVLEAFRAFDPAAAELAKRVFDQNHLDSEIRKGKDSGAFCASVVPNMTPYVLLNYQGRARDVAVMAHELGHAIHSMLAAGHSAFTFQASLPLAETASTFGEMMLTDKLLRGEPDPDVQRDLRFKQVDDAYATIMRQSFLALFERRAHEMIRENATVDEIAAAYLENIREQFGDAIELSSEFQWEWISIPHIYHTPFYVYAYAFGQLLVLSLYQQFKAEGESFKPKYLKILTAGGSESPEKILSGAGIDIRSANFWQAGFDVIDGWVRELEGLS